MPNTLNWPSYVNDRISLSVARCIKEAHEEGDLPEELSKWIDVPSGDLPSIRSCVTAPPGWILVESDYATAEMHGLAVISGDKMLQKLLSEPDPDWVYMKAGNKYGIEAVRVGFSPTAETGIPETAHDPEYIMKAWKDNEYLGEVTDDMLVRDDEGNPVHTSFDIHWSLIERTYGKCRESMVKKIDRNAAKVVISPSNQ